MKLKRLLLWGAVLCLAGCKFPLSTPRTPTPTPMPTAITTPSPTLTPTPLPSPTPTPLPQVRLAQGSQAMMEGDYQRALQEYQDGYNQVDDADSKAAALFGAGLVYIEQEDQVTALDVLRQLTEQYPQSPSAAGAYFHLAAIYTSLQRYQEALDAYDQYLALRPGLIDSFVQEKRGDLFSDLGDYPNAVLAYQAAIKTSHLDNQDSLATKIARTYAAREDYQTAITAYDAIYSQSQSDYTRAQVTFLAGQALMALGQTQEAYDRFLHTVADFPRAYEAYSALFTLVNDGVPVDDFQRGLVDYFAEEYPVAVEAFDRYLAANPTPDPAAYFYKGLALLAISESLYPTGSQLRANINAAGGVAEDIAALQAFQTLIDNHPDAPNWADAWDEMAYTQWVYQDKPEAAAQTLINFTAAAPTHPKTPDFLFMAGRYLERAGKLMEAAEIWERLGDEFADSNFAFQAYFFAGICYYRLADYPNAEIDFKQSLTLTSDTYNLAAAHLWIGKALAALGRPEDATTLWQQAAITDPTGYYSERARDLLLNRQPFTSPETVDLGIDLESERVAAGVWVRETFNIPPEVDLLYLGDLEQNARFRSGHEFWTLGLVQESRRELEDLRQEMSQDPASTFRLVQFFYDLGLYRSAILASRQVLNLAGMEDAATMMAPDYFNHVRFGTYFKDLVLSSAKAEGLDALLLFSLIRQESLFEGFIQSPAGARGLMQIMPDTGSQLADNLGWPDDYIDSDLYRPVINIPLGSHYLASQRAFFDGNLYAALAAYNGGPGNTMIWQDLARGDLDLFLEVVRIQETRDYIRRVVENYAIYRGLYGRGGGG